jgi:hypothetical protein
MNIAEVVKAAVDDVKLGEITPVLKKIRPAVESMVYVGESSSKKSRVGAHGLRE